MSHPTPGVLVIGDALLDRYIMTGQGRPCPEGPFPRMVERGIDERPGGAANVAANIVSLGCPAFLASVFGNDPAATTLLQKIGEAGVIAAPLQIPGPTPTVTRIAAESRTLLRVDATSVPLSLYDAQAAMIQGALADPSFNIRLIVVADYGKGVLSLPLAERIRRLAHDHGLPILVDARPDHADWYAGVSLYKPNLAEALAYLDARAVVHPGLAAASVTDGDRAVIAAREIRRLLNCLAVVVTCGGSGAAIADPAERLISADPLQVVDVTGAGDTFMAALAVNCLGGETLNNAVAFANAAAGLAVQRYGTTIVSRFTVDNLLTEKDFLRKILDEGKLASYLRACRQHEQRVALANGCFDGLHAGHLSLFSRAAEIADVVVVAVNDDASLRQLKGESRPLVPLRERLTQIAMQPTVDRVVVFDGDAAALVRRLRPDVLIKGEDALLAGVVPGADTVADYGGHVEFAPTRFPLHSSQMAKS